MLFLSSNPYDAEKSRAYLESLITAKADFEIKKKLPRRTSNQNRYLHAILGYFGASFGLTMEEVKQTIFKREVNADLFRLEPAVIGGRVYERWRSTADLDTGEMTTAIDRFRNYSASVAGLYISSPEDEQFILYCEQVIQQNKEFI